MSQLALAIAVKGEWDADRLVEQLTAAGVPTDIEVVVACDPESAPTNAPPSVAIYTTPGASLFELWALAIANSRSPWVAILHGYGLPGPVWFSAMEREIELEGWKDGYWGPVEPAFGDADRRMIGYLTEYCQFHRPIPPRLMEVPGSNLVLPRQRIESSHDFSKTRLLQEGLAPKYVEAAVINYARPIKFGDYIARRFRHGRAYAAARQPRLPLGRAIPLSLALPFVRTARILRHAATNPTLRKSVLRFLPAIMLAESFWSAGELVGYVTRRQGSAAKLD